MEEMLMNLREALTTNLLDRHGIEKSVYDKMARIEVAQYANRKITDVLISYPSLLKILADNDQVTSICFAERCDYHAVKPRLVIEGSRATLVMNGCD